MARSANLAVLSVIGRDQKGVVARVSTYLAGLGINIEDIVQRAHRESLGGVPDVRTQELLAELLTYPGVAAAWRRTDPGAPLLPVLPVTFAKAGRRFDYFSAVTTLGTPQDVTVQEIRIECFHPADDATPRPAHELRASAC